MKKSTLETLKAEHSLAKKAMSFILNLVGDIKKRKPISFIEIGKKTDLIHTFLIGHHKKEMEVFSFLIEEKEVKKIDLINILKREHDLGAEYFQNVLKIINSDDKKKPDANLLAFHLEKYFSLLDDHIKKEEKDLFPLVRKYISGKKEKLLTEKYQKMNLAADFRKVQAALRLI